MTISGSSSSVEIGCRNRGIGGRIEAARRIGARISPDTLRALCSGSSLGAVLGRSRSRARWRGAAPDPRFGGSPSSAGPAERDGVDDRDRARTGGSAAGMPGLGRTGGPHGRATRPRAWTRRCHRAMALRPTSGREQAAATGSAGACARRPAHGTRGRRSTPRSASATIRGAQPGGRGHLGTRDRRGARGGRRGPHGRRARIGRRLERPEIELAARRRPHEVDQAPVIGAMARVARRVDLRSPVTPLARGIRDVDSDEP